MNLTIHSTIFDFAPTGAELERLGMPPELHEGEYLGSMGAMQPLFTRLADLEMLLQMRAMEAEQQAVSRLMDENFPDSA